LQAINWKEDLMRKTPSPKAVRFLKTVALGTAAVDGALGAAVLATGNPSGVALVGVGAGCATGAAALHRRQRSAERAAANSK
jgi:hypothetical protein